MIGVVAYGLVRIGLSSAVSPIARQLGGAAGLVGTVAGGPAATNSMASWAERPIAGCPARSIMSRACRA
eukprot:7086054-Pyramimonas_sp.AAC.1